MAKKTICLINPPSIIPRDVVFSSVYEPAGLAYIAAVLEQNGFKVFILDALILGWNRYTQLERGRKLVGLTYEEIKAYVKQVSPNIVGISALFSIQASSAYRVAAAAKEADSSIITVLGGAHPTANPLECLSRPEVDFVVMGEGELTMLDLVRALESDCQKLDSIDGIGYKKAGTATLNKRREPIKDLDTLPFPARHLLPMERYQDASKAFQSSRLMVTYGKRWAKVITSRGCPYRCNFCQVHLLHGRNWRARSPENVIGEIEQLVHSYSVNVVCFEDDNLTLDKNRMLRICQLITQKRLGIKWDTSNGVRADSLDKELLTAMKEAGCVRIVVAPESGNQYVVDHIIKKKLNLRKVEEAVSLSKQLGLRVDCFFVIGSIGETKENIRETLAFASKLRKLGASYLIFSIATPHYGTDLYEEAREKRYLRLEDEQDLYRFEPHIETPEFTLKEIAEFYKQALRINPVIRIDELGLALRIFLSNPMRGLKLAYNRLRSKGPASV